MKPRHAPVSDKLRRVIDMYGEDYIVNAVKSHQELVAASEFGLRAAVILADRQPGWQEEAAAIRKALQASRP